MLTVDSSLRERLERLENDLTERPPRFVRVSSIPYAIFHYEPAQERTLRRELNNLAARLRRKQNWRVHFVSLGTLLWEAIERCEGLEAVVELERAEGFQAAQEQIYTYLTEEFWQPLPRLVAEAIAAQKATQPDRDLVLLYRAGAFAPNLYSMSRLMNELSDEGVQVPVVLFYPGRREGTFGLRYMNLEDRAALGNYRVQIY